MNTATEKDPIQGRLLLEVIDPETQQERVIHTVAPFAEFEVETKPQYTEPAKHSWATLQMPELIHVDLIIRVRMKAGSTPDGVLWKMTLTPPAETTEEIVLRAIRETTVQLLNGPNRALLAQEIVDALSAGGRA